MAAAPAAALITTTRSAVGGPAGLHLQELAVGNAEEAVLDLDAAFAGARGRVSLTSQRILFRPLEHSDTVKLYNKMRAEIVSDLGLIEHVAVTTFEAAQSVIITLRDGSERAINFPPGPESRDSRDALRAAIQRALSAMMAAVSEEKRTPSRRVRSRVSAESALSSPSSTFDPSELMLEVPSTAPETDIGEISRKITTTGIHLGERVMLIGTSQYDHQRGTLRYIGPVHFQLGETCGVELDIPGGSNSGRFGDVRYFFCPAMHGTFVAVRCIAPEPEKAAERRAALPALSTEAMGRRKLLLERPQWEADDAAEDCRVCFRSFSLTRRKHHCRSCGVLCCGSCSSSRLKINYLAYFDEERVCDDCALFLPTFCTASGVIMRPGNRVGLDKSEEAQADQLAAIDKIIEMLQGAEDALLMARCGVSKLLIMLATLPIDQVKRRALFGLWKVAEFAQLHPTFIEKGGLTVLLDILKSETHPEILINAVSAMALICENTRYRYPAARAGAVQILLLHAMQPFIRMQLIATEAIATLSQEPQCQDYICESDDGEILFKMLALVVSLPDARCQEHMFCAIAHMTTQDRHVRKVADANVRIGDVFKQLSTKLLSDERADMGDKSAREHSLVHLACILANLGCLRDPVQGTACRALCDLARLHKSTDLQDHVSRGLANFSSSEVCASDILRMSRHVVVPLQVTSVANFWAQCSSLCAFFNLITLRRKDTMKQLRGVPACGAILVELAEHPSAAPVVKSLAYRMVLMLSQEKGIIDPAVVPRIRQDAEALNLPQVPTDPETSLFEAEPAVPTLFRFGDKRTYLEQVALEQAVRSSMRKRQLRKVRLLDSLAGIASDRARRLPTIDAACSRMEHNRTKEVLLRVSGIVAERSQKLTTQVQSLRADLLTTKEDADEE
mmetsp:Transcript_27085/g.81189  ORF Transcript_27085/g.81189 Transcript_27085/m.81189 type:complete len:905 (+) Transcript_27085:287-3001(+)